MPTTKGFAGLTIADLALVWLAYSGPRGSVVSGLWLYLATLAALAPLFLGTMARAGEGAAARYAALFGVLWFGLLPSHAQTVVSAAQRPLLASTLGIAAGLALYLGKQEWRKWGIFALPVAATSFLHPQGLLFAVLLGTLILLFEKGPEWRAGSDLVRPLGFGLLASLPALLAHPRFELAAVLTGIARGLQYSLTPWSTAEPAAWWVALAPVVVFGLGVATTRQLWARPISFGLWWFLFLAAAAPEEPLVAGAGLALAGSWLAALAIRRAPAAVTRWVPVLAAAGLMACGVAVIQENVFLVDIPAPRPDTAEAWLRESREFEARGKHLEAIAAARGVLRLDPQSAQAYDLMGQAYANLHLLDEGIEAEHEAQRVQPNYGIAEHNLHRMLEMKYLGR